MNVHDHDIVVRYIRTHNKTRKLVTYRSDDCDLRIKHEKICAFITQRFVPSIFSKGYVKGQSIYNNARAHMYNDYFVMLDIKDFFPHISHEQLVKKLLYELNIKRPNQVDMRDCRYIVDQCSVSSSGIPLGFVTSPVLSNLYLKEFDCIFYGKLKELGLRQVIFTRYADDITVSYQSDDSDLADTVSGRIVELASSILKRYGLTINAHKIRKYDLHVSNHVRITGVNITRDDSGRRRLTVGRALKDQLFWDAISCLQTPDPEKIQQVKGLQSFVLSVEKKGYESVYSPAMMEIVRFHGFQSLKELIDSFSLDANADGQE